MPDDAYTRKQACINCNRIININYPGTPIYNRTKNEIPQRCPHCNIKFIAERYYDGSTSIRKAFFQEF